MRYQRNATIYSVIILGYVLIVGSISLFFDKASQIEYLTAHTTPTTISFFNYITLLGEWPGILTFGILVFANQRARAFSFTVACLLTSIVINLLKRFAFTEEVRPRLFAQNNHIAIPDSASTLMHYSFPSGHTAIAVCMGFCICLLIHRNWIPYLVALLAIGVALSRIFIFAHFAIDTAVGAGLGLGLAWLGISIFEVGKKRIRSSFNK